jgi:hypothetical protein
MQLIPLKFLRLCQFLEPARVLGGGGIGAQLISASRVTRLFQFYVSFRVDCGSVLLYVCDRLLLMRFKVIKATKSPIF